MSVKKCQCGATPRYRVVRHMGRGRMRPSRRERLVCPACGNATWAGESRKLLESEWDSAGRFGQAEVLGLGVKEVAHA
jgi:hypothetical protein